MGGALDPEELERMIEHVAGDVQKAEEAHEKLKDHVQEFLISDARSRGELAGYIKNAARDIATVKDSSEKSAVAIQTQVKESSEALWSAVDALREGLTTEIRERAVESVTVASNVETTKKELKGDIRMAGYAKIITFLGSAALILFTFYVNNG